jgi:hypothetical protein
MAVPALATAVLLAACGDRGGRAVGDGPYAKQVADAVPRIEQYTGLKFRSPPKVERRTKAEVRDFLVKKFDEQSPAQEMAAQERVYKRFGLIPDSLQLRPYMIELLSEQIVGFYDPATKTLYVVDGAPPEMVSVTIAHELVHALQDQYISLDSLQRQRGDDDRATAAQAVIEGQATLEQMKAALGSNNIAAGLPGGWDRIRTQIRDNQSSMPVFAAAPMVIQETLIFPYLSGAEFMRNFEAKQQGKSPFGEMPVSTEQVLHEDRYFARRDPPVRVALPAPADGRIIYENDFGEFGTRLFLYQHLQDIGGSARGAAGWGGDRYALFQTGNGEGLAWVTAWDTDVDAGEFFDLVDDATSKRFGNAKPRGAGSTTRAYEVKGRTITITATAVGGRPIVAYVDVPTGAPAPLDLAKVRLEQ